MLSSRLTMNGWVTPAPDTGTQSGARSHIPAIGIPWWRHQMGTFPRYWPFVRGIHLSPGNSPHKGHCRGALIFYLRLNKRLSKQSWGWWFETPSHPLWRHCNANPLLLNHGNYSLLWVFWRNDSPTQIFHRILVALRWVNIKLQENVGYQSPQEA